MAYFPITGDESADNTSAVTITINDQAAFEFQVTIEITAGTALAGTIGVAIKPFGVTAFQDVKDSAGDDFTFDCTDLAPARIRGKFSAIKFTPADLTAGCKFTPYLDKLETA